MAQIWNEPENHSWTGWVFGILVDLMNMSESNGTYATDFFSSNPKQYGWIHGWLYCIQMDVNIHPIWFDSIRFLWSYKSNLIWGRPTSDSAKIHFNHHPKQNVLTCFITLAVNSPPSNCFQYGLHYFPLWSTPQFCGHHPHWGGIFLRAKQLPDCAVALGEVYPDNFSRGSPPWKKQLFSVLQTWQRSRVRRFGNMGVLHEPASASQNINASPGCQQMIARAYPEITY